MRPEATISGSGKAQLTWRKAKFPVQLSRSPQPSAQFHSYFSTPDLYTLTGRLWLMLYFPVFIPRFLVSNSVCSVTDLVGFCLACPIPLPHHCIFRSLKKCGLKLCGPSIVDIVHKCFLPTHLRYLCAAIGSSFSSLWEKKILNQPVWICSK